MRSWHSRAVWRAASSGPGVSPFSVVMSAISRHGRPGESDSRVITRRVARCELAVRTKSPAHAIDQMNGPTLARGAGDVGSGKDVAHAGCLLACD